MLKRALLLAALSLLAPATVADRPVAAATTCAAASDAFQSAASDLADALQIYSDCVANSTGLDDCSSEFNLLRSGQDGFESAVLQYRGTCG